MLSAEEKILELEKQIFSEVRQSAAAEAKRIRATASAIAQLDVTAPSRNSRPRIATRVRVFRKQRYEDHGRPSSGNRKLAEKKLAASFPTIFSSTIPPTSSR